MFLCLPLVAATEPACPAEGPVQWHTLERIVDGDTLYLQGGLKVRVLGINSPELGRGQPGQPYARQSQQAAKAFFAQSGSKGGKQVGLQVGSEPKDRYGRTLAHVFNRQGESLAASLLAEGLGWLVVIAPNTRYADCLAGQRQQARQARRGVWSLDEYRPIKATDLVPGSSGFMLVRGEIAKVSQSRNSWWLETGKLAIRIRREDAQYFASGEIEALLAKTITVSGWVVDRSDSRAVKENDYPPFMVTVSHPLMIGI